MDPRRLQHCERLDSAKPGRLDRDCYRSLYKINFGFRFVSIVLTVVQKRIYPK